MKLIFLDIDGVLNDHATFENGYCGIKAECVARLNRILLETGANLVISSAWRYLIISRSMTREGFQNLLLSHGVNCYKKIRGTTQPDMGAITRGQQILAWLICNGFAGTYVVLDDLDDAGIAEEGLPFVRTDGKVGLTDADADKAIAILNRGK